MTNSVHQNFISWHFSASILTYQKYVTDILATIGQHYQKGGFSYINSLLIEQIYQLSFWSIHQMLTSLKSYFELIFFTHENQSL